MKPQWALPLLFRAVVFIFFLLFSVLLFTILLFVVFDSGDRTKEVAADRIVSPVPRTCPFE